MHLVVGLGNPGRRYSGSRHNIGFQVIEALSRRLESPVPEYRCHSMTAVTGFRGHKVVLARPMTYMNRSGAALVELLHFFNLDYRFMLVICDDLDLQPGVIRLRKKGRSGGHRGLGSIIEALESSDFPRLRVGIGRPQSGLNAAEYVLLPPDPTDRELLEKAVAKAEEAVVTCMEAGLDQAMNIYNIR